MGYSTQHYVTVEPDDGMSSSVLLARLDVAIGYEHLASYSGYCDDEELQFSGKYYDLEDKLREATVGLPGTFCVTGIGEESFVPPAEVDIWRLYARNGVVGKKVKAILDLPTVPDIDAAAPVTPAISLVLAVKSDEELRELALSGSNEALDALVERAAVTDA